MTVRARVAADRAMAAWSGAAWSGVAWSGGGVVRGGVVRGGVVVPELPHATTGKLQKTTLRTRYRDYLVSGG